MCIFSLCAAAAVGLAIAPDDFPFVIALLFRWDPLLKNKPACASTSVPQPSTNPTSHRRIAFVFVRCGLALDGETGGCLWSASMWVFLRGFCLWAWVLCMACAV
eukprot:RCo020249